MPKGFFTQGVCLLTNGRTTVRDVRSALEEHGFEIIKQVPATENWCFGGPSLVVPFRPDVNGYAVVDVVSHPWPDGMGNPNSDPTTFGAWCMGHFGPFAFPGGLARAGQHAWAWKPASTIAHDHGGFIRVRTSYIFGAERDEPVFPADCDPLAELMFVSRLALALLTAPGVTCYYNPNGEVLRNRSSFREVWELCMEQEQIPLPLWMNIRFFNLDEKLGFMDTVGNGQLDARDVEAIFPKSKYNPRDVDYYLRNVTHYLLGLNREIKTGETIDGPGENDLSWTVEVLDKGLVEPPRPVLRLYPQANREAVRKAIGTVG